jgi:hypothetical protein
MSDPLAPVLGDPFEVSAVGTSLTSIALDVAAQATRLRSLSDSSWTGTAAVAARSRTATLPPMLDKAQASYATAGGALSSYARSLASAQAESVAAISRATRASAELAASRAALAAAAASDASAAAAARILNLPSPPPTAPRFSGAIEEASANLRAAYALNAEAHDAQLQAARAAALSLQRASHLGIRNASWMHRFTHAVGSGVSTYWVSTLRDFSRAGQIVAAGAGVVALVLAVGGVFFPPLEVAAAAFESVSLTSAAVAAVADTTLAASGKGSWTTVGIDAATLAPAGVGRVVTKLGPEVMESRLLTPKTIVHASSDIRRADGTLAMAHIRTLWANVETLPGHFVDHAVDVAAVDAYDYVLKAAEFLRRSRIEQLPTKIEGNGTTRIFDPALRLFGSFASDDRALTVFIPDSRNYWERQPGRLVIWPK